MAGDPTDARSDDEGLPDETRATGRTDARSDDERLKDAACAPVGLGGRFRLAARIVTLASGVLFLASGLYGVAAPMIWGHYGYHGGEYATRARHTLRHGAILPGNVPGWDAPKPEELYLHHPILTHQLVTLTMVILGDHEYAVRGAGLLAAFVSFLLLVLLVRRRWGPWPAALAGIAYTLVPINVWYANHIDPGFPSIACLLGFFYLYLEWLDHGRWRHGLGALVCMALAGGFEWSPYLAAVPIGMHVLVVGLWRRGRYLAFVPLYVVAVLLPAALHFGVIYHLGHWKEMFEAYHIRTKWDAATFYEGALRYAREMLGPYVEYVVPVWLATLVGRLALRRLQARDLLGVSFLFALVAYIQLFKGGVLTHAYRFLYGNVVCTIIVVDLVLVAAALLSLPAWRRRWRPLLHAGLATVAALAAIFFMSRPAVAGLLESREHGGIPLWRVYDPDLGRIAFVETVRQLTNPEDVLLIHRSFRYRMEANYYLDRDRTRIHSLIGLERQLRRTPPRAAATKAAARARTRAAGTTQPAAGDAKPAPAGEGAAAGEQPLRPRVLIVVPKMLSTRERVVLADLARRYPLVQVQDFMLVDLRRTTPGVRVERLVDPPAQPWWRRYLVGPHARRARRPDALREAEYISEFGLRVPDDQVPDLPLPKRGFYSALLPYHNLHQLRGDAARVKEARARVMEGLSVAGPRPLVGDTEVLGLLLTTRGTLHTFFVAGAARPAPATLYVEARTEGRTFRFDHELQPGADAWRPGYLYMDSTGVTLPPGRYQLSVAMESPRAATDLLLAPQLPALRAPLLKPPREPLSLVPQLADPASSGAAIHKKERRRGPMPPPALGGEVTVEGPKRAGKKR